MKAMGRRHELMPWAGRGGGGPYLIGCPVSQSPVPETWSLFDFELLMEFLQSEIEQDSSRAPTLVPLSVSFSASLRGLHSSFSVPQEAKQMEGELWFPSNPAQGHRPVTFS